MVRRTHPFVSGGRQLPSPAARPFCRVQSAETGQKLPVTVGAHEQEAWKLITENMIAALANFAPADGAEIVGWLYVA